MSAQDRAFPSSRFDFACFKRPLQKYRPLPPVVCSPGFRWIGRTGVADIDAARSPATMLIPAEQIAASASSPVDDVSGNGAARVIWAVYKLQRENREE